MILIELIRNGAQYDHVLKKMVHAEASELFKIEIERLLAAKYIFRIKAGLNSPAYGITPNGKAAIDQYASYVILS